MAACKMQQVLGDFAMHVGVVLGRPVQTRGCMGKVAGLHWYAELPPRPLECSWTTSTTVFSCESSHHFGFLVTGILHRHYVCKQV